MYINARNGYGLVYLDRQDATSQSYNPWFDNHMDYIRHLSERHLILSGEPGAGKSHIAEDVLRVSQGLGKRCLQISCHINGSSPKGRETTLQLVREIANFGEESVLILDNADYVVYTGGNRKRRVSSAKVNEYRRYLAGVISLADRASVPIFSTSHSPEWRYNHSLEDNAEEKFFGIYPPGSFSYTIFDGQMSENNVLQILKRRNIAPTTAQDIAEQLSRINQLNFRNAYHIATETIASQGILKAVEQVKKLKDQKITGGK